MKVYHGSTNIIEHPLTQAGRRNLDFGQGFYVTDLREQAIYWANRPLNAGLPHWLNIYELDMEAVLAQGYHYLKFDSYDFQWLEFVVANRRGEKRWQGYDLIEGGIANDRVFNTIELYAAGLTPREEALERLRYEKPNNQLCLLNQSLIDSCLHFISAEEVSAVSDRKENQP
ncbi:MAG: DUF3990 domain-containing protein [Bacteroides sp.]|nr:DUF3990 domain-containing protein [Bacteroides sp.]